MRTFLGLLVAGGIIAAVVLHKQRESAAPGPSALTPSPLSSAAAPALVPAGEPAKHNWPKRALDRAADVKRQVGEKRKSDETN